MSGRAALPAVWSGSDPNERGRTSVYKNLEESPGSFAFAQAARIVGRHLGAQPGVNREDALRFTVNPNLSFPPSDIEAIFYHERPDGLPSVMLMLNLMGLHGAASPLPAYFTEHVAQQQDEPDALRDFFDIFHQRLISLLYRSWEKYRYYLQFRHDADDPMSGRFFSFLGMGYTQLRRTGGVSWPRLLAYTGLIAFKGEAAGSLESTLRHYFRHPQVVVIPCIRRRVPIPPDQQSSLGHGNSSLALDCHIGEYIADQSGKFRIRLSELNWERFNDFLPDTDIFLQLTTVVRSILRSRLQFDVELRLRLEEVRPTLAGEVSVSRLGWSSWLGDGGDGVVVLEAGSHAEHESGRPGGGLGRPGARSA
jgi:type VI secretion system protein ImpH